MQRIVSVVRLRLVLIVSLFVSSAPTGGCGSEIADAETEAESVPEIGAEPPVETEPEPETEPETEPDPGPAHIVISAAGDLVLNPHAMHSIRDDGEHAYNSLLVGYAASIAEHELAIVNLEQPLVNDVVPLDPGWPRQDTRRPRRSPVLGATPPLADALAAAGVDVVTLANNHAYDQGRLGLERTVEECTRVGIVPIGAAATSDSAYRPTVIERDGVRIAFLAASDFFNQTASGDGTFVAARLSDDRLDAAITAARDEADLVVLAVHWSRDFVPAVRSSERRLARELIDAGADIILGTGPHVLHEVERLESARGEAVVAYSLGNIVSGMGRSYRIGHPPQHFVHPANVTPEARDGLVLRIDIEPGPPVRVRSLEAVPLWTENNWNAHRRTDEPHRIRVVTLADAGEEVRAEREAVIRAAIGSDVVLEEP